MNTVWARVRLGDVLRFIPRPVTVEPAHAYREIGIRSHGRGIFHKPPMTGLDIGSKKVFYIEPGDFVLNIVFAWEGAVAVTSDAETGMIASHRFPTFRPDPIRLEVKYLQYWCQTELGRSLLDRVSPGGAGRNRTLNRAAFLNQEIPLPPLAEQRRVVARIEELADQIHEARTLRQRAEEEAGAIVRAARNDCVSALRRRHSDARLGDICAKITDGPHVSPRYVDEGVPFISVRNINEMRLDFSSAKFVTNADHLEFSQKARVERGDVLYTKGGTTGVARRVDTDRPFSIWVHVALLKLYRGKAEAGFVEHMLNSPSSQEQANSFTRGSSNRDLGLSRMAQIVFPLPPLSEQRVIVAELDALQADVSQLKRLQAETAADLDTLLPTVLHSAFKGEL